jgi:hypothetical protein
LFFALHCIAVAVVSLHYLHRLCMFGVFLGCTKGEDREGRARLDKHDWLEIYMFLGLSRLKLRNMMTIIKSKLPKVIEERGLVVFEVFALFAQQVCVSLCTLPLCDYNFDCFGIMHVVSVPFTTLVPCRIIFLNVG